MGTNQFSNEASGGVRGGLKRLLQVREFTIALLVILMCVGLSVATPSFLRVANIRVLLQGMSTDMMIAVPMCVSMIAGIPDFSGGSSMCLCGVVCGLCLLRGIPVPLAILIALLCGFCAGGLNGVIVNKLGLVPMVATLGTWMAYKGLALVLLGGATLSSFPDSFLLLGRVTVFGIPIPIVYMFVIVIAGILLLKYNRFFHDAYYIGSNRASAKLAGINVERFTMITYALTGMIAAFCGCVVTSRLGSASQNIGDNLEFRNIVAIIVGGASMEGGGGSIFGAFLGVMLMQLVGNAITLLYLDSSYTKVINGAILILAVGLDTLLKRRRGRA